MKKDRNTSWVISLISFIFILTNANAFLASEHQSFSKAGVEKAKIANTIKLNQANRAKNKAALQLQQSILGFSGLNRLVTKDSFDVLKFNYENKFANQGGVFSKIQVISEKDLNSIKKEENCDSKYPKHILIGELDTRKFENYNFKFSSESSAISDMKSKLRRKEKFKDFKFGSWRDAYGRLWDDYEDAYHKNAQCRVKGGDWENCESIYKVKACKESGSSPYLKEVYGWG